MNDWKDRLGVVFSTNPDYNYETQADEEPDTLPKNRQRLRVSIEKNGRGGKVVTLVKGFVGTADDLKEVGRMLKSRCGVGGSVKDGEVIIQGQLKEKVIKVLKDEGYSDVK